MAEQTPQKYHQPANRGTWVQTGGRGNIELVFNEDFTNAKGWWNDGGSSPKRGAFIK